MRLARLDSPIHYKVDGLMEYLDENGLELSVVGNRIFVNLSCSEFKMHIVDSDNMNEDVLELPYGFEFRLRVYE